MNMRLWKISNIDKLAAIEYEATMRNIYAKIYVALINLKQKDFIYSDMKPMNVLLDSNNEPYLIDLESVVKTNNNRTCLRTNIYFPQELKGMFIC